MTNIIKVRFNKDGQPQGREYSYLSPIEVVVGDIVEMETQRGIAKGTVTQINVPRSEIEQFRDRVKSIIGKVELSEIDKILEESKGEDGKYRLTSLFYDNGKVEVRPTKEDDETGHYDSYDLFIDEYKTKEDAMEYIKDCKNA
ncbi:hypothetical protein [uncultured Tissierella sp.]|uniref:hypothetical protein n=1 Tax=uncultured Tissierella sp. TaxID=448160 RepID=UPI0028047F68|nr:hypothetical protein [uncultured Tissierella sp.]MDU5080282.1 hypothetical protein [Bacillota bacterium]